MPLQRQVPNYRSYRTKKKNNLLDVTAYEYDDFLLNQFISPLNNKEKYVEYAMKNFYAKSQHHNTIIK